MSLIKRTEHPLLQSIDAIVAKHGADNEQLKNDLLLVRAQLAASLKRRKWADVGLLAMRVYRLVEFFFDNHPPH